MHAAPRTRLRELFLLFVKLGATSFGGPAAHIAMMQDEVVERRRWLTSERFLDLVGMCNLIPGPSSTELAIHIGHDRAGWRGLLVAGLSFIVPAVLVTALLAWAYVTWGTLPASAWLLAAVKPVILGVVVQAIWRLAPRAARTLPLRALGLAALVAAALGVPELVVLLGAGLLALTAAPRAPLMAAPAPLGLAGLGAGAVAASTTLTLPGLFGVFVKIGSVLFGSGYVLLAFLQAELVDQRGWLTQGQLIDAVAVGQVTPGPVFTTATFIGYVLAGPTGAALATSGIFLPAFVFVALSGPLIPRIRGSRLAGAFLDGVNVASLALMIVVTAELARSAITSPWTALLALASAAALVLTRVSSTWLVLGAAALGLLAHLATGA